MVDAIRERARDVGRLLAQTDEYKALKRANERVADDRETVTLLNRLGDLQEQLTGALRDGTEPPREQQEEYEQLLNGLQARPEYQGIVAAQSNFDRLMMQVNEEIGRGIEVGEGSRIITSA